MESFLQYLATQPEIYVYPVLFTLIFLENTVPLVPGDLVLIFSAYLAGRNVFPMLILFAITITGSVVGFIFNYMVGNKLGRAYFEKKNYPFLSAKRMEKADHYFQKYGDGAILINRFVPGTRLLIGLIAGFTKSKLIKAICFTFISIVLWNGLIFTIGKFFCDNWEEIKFFVSKYNSVVCLLLFIAVLILVLYQLNKKFKVKKCKN
jgi:membrane protein DedA with SNARE-associated domain